MTAQDEAGSPEPQVLIEQDLCTGDGLCVQYAPDIFAFDIDGLAYVKDLDGQLQQAEGARVPVPAPLLDTVIAAARDCPGSCIHVTTAPHAALATGADREPSQQRLTHETCD